MNLLNAFIILSNSLLIATLAALTLAPAAQAMDLPATLTCTFTSECIAEEICNETDFAISLAVRGVAAQSGLAKVEVTATSDADTLTLAGPWDGSALSAHGPGAFPTSHTLTTALPGSAIYTTHIGTDLPITYTGECR